METYELTLTEERDYAANEPKLIGFRASRKATLTIRDLGRAQDIMDALIEAPIQLWEDMEARVENENVLRERAKIAAFEDAKLRAELYAKLAGRRLGEVYRVGDKINWEANWQSDVPMYLAVRRDEVPMFQIGDIEIKQQVRVIYLLD